MKVAYFSEYPFSIAYGGIETRLLRSLKIMSRSDIDVSLLDPYDRIQEYDLLHIFGSPPHLDEIINFASKKCPVLIDSVSGAGPYSVNTTIKKALYRLLSTKLLKTDYTRMQNIYTNVDAIICINRSEKFFIENFYDLPPSKVSIVHKPVDNAFYSNVLPLDVSPDIAKLSNFVLFVGNITKRKNPLLLAQVLRSLNLRGVFVGGLLTNEKAYFNQFIHEVREGNHVWFEYIKPASSDIVFLFKKAKLFCLPSYFEGQPHVVLEAIASKCPVLLGDAAYVRNDLLFNSLSTCAINFNALVNYIASMPLPQVREDMHNLPEQYTEQYYQSVMCNIYKSLV